MEGMCGRCQAAAGDCLVALACGRSSACNTGCDHLVCFALVAGTNYDVIEVGLLAPEPYPTGELLTGQVRGCSGLSVYLACDVFSALRLWLHAGKSWCHMLPVQLAACADGLHAAPSPRRSATCWLG